MSVNEMSLQIKKATFDHRLLGAIGMICSPMLFIASFFYSSDANVTNPYQLLASLGGVLYLSGIAASAIGMRQLRATGNGWGSAVLFALQLVALFLAAMFDVLEFAAPQMKQTTVFFVTDMAYPFSHLLMNVVGIAVVKANVWRGWRRIPAFLCGLALPSFFIANAVVGRENSFVVFPVVVTIGFFLLGYAVTTSKSD